MKRRIAIFTAVAMLIATIAPATVAAQSGKMTPSVGVHPVAQLARAHGNVFGCENHQLDNPDLILCYRPQAIRAAYGIQQLLDRGDTGKGRTIVIVDAFDNPYIAQDLAMFDAQFGLPDPVFKVVYPDGKTPFDFADDNMVGWSGEISLDVEWAHAVAPAAAITLVLARSNNDPDLNRATRYAVDHNLGDVISQSFGEPEECAAARDVGVLHRIYEDATRKGITLLASSGDDGAGTSCDGVNFKPVISASWPATDPYVTGVGGTNLQLDPATGAYVAERSWADMYSACFPTESFGCSGGGFSKVYARPHYQAGSTTAGHGRRGVPDVAYNAGVDGGVLTHWGVGNEVFGGDPADPDSFWIFGGTSAGAPQWAGLVALADQLNRHRVGSINDSLYAIARSNRLYGSAFHDIKTGNNNFAWYDADGNLLGQVTGFKAGKGWDPVTGLGSPKANVLVPLLAAFN